jgi:hypothetical protein
MRAVLRPTTTMGLEIEIEGLPAAAVTPLKYISFEVHNDGSMRGSTYIVDGLPLMLQHVDRRSGTVIVPSGMRDWRAETIGLEMVTRPYQYATLMPLAERLAQDLKHIPQTNRTSIHIHVDIGNRSWQYVQQCIAWAYYLEAPLFRIGAGGSRQGHRGSRKERDGNWNDYRFCRPLSNPIGIQVSGGSKWYPLVNIERLLKAETASEMLAHWGRLDTIWHNMGHYIPHRLHMVNLVSVARNGTMEWRLFDGVYQHLPTFIQVVMSIHDLVDQGVYPHQVLPTPLRLGEDMSEISMANIEDILQLDLSPVWGSHWPKGVYHDNRSSHYAPMRVNSLKSQEVQQIETVGYGRDAGSLDRGQESFMYYSRS